MFAVEIAAFPFYARLSGRPECSKRSRHVMEHTADSRDPQALVCAALAEMVPSTAAEIAVAVCERRNVLLARALSESVWPRFDGLLAGVPATGTADHGELGNVPPRCCGQGESGRTSACAAK